MIEQCINEVVYIDVAELVKEEMFKVAIMANGVYSTFDLKTYPAPMDNVELQLHYMQVTDEEIDNSPEYYSKVIYPTDADCHNILKCIEKVRKMKEDLVKYRNAIWSTISVSEFGSGEERRFEIKYKRVSIDVTKKSSETDKMITEPDTDEERIEPKSCDTSDVVIHNQSEAAKPAVPVKHTDSEICDFSNVINRRDGTTYTISELVTYDKEYLYLPVHFGTINYPRIFRIKIPLKTLKDALDQLE